MVTHVTTNREQWDAFAVRNGGNFLQSWDWSLFQEALGRRTFRYRLDVKDAPEGENPAAQFVTVVLPLPLGRRFSYLPRGPVLAMQGGADAVRARFDATVVALREMAARDRDTFVRLEWPYPAAPDAAIDEAAFVSHGLQRGGHTQPAHTVIADLANDEAALLAAMHQKTRYNVRVAEKHGVTVSESKDMDAFLALLAETAERDGFHTHEKSYYEKMFSMLGERPGVPAGLRVRLWLAHYDGRAVAGALTAEFGDTVTYLHGASRSADRKVMAPFLLHWQIMRDAKARGFAHYDFWGVAPNDDENHPWAGITRFKKGFGGRFVSYFGTWELPVHYGWLAAYRMVKRLRGQR